VRTVFFGTDRWTRSFPRTGGVLRASRKLARRRASSTGAGAIALRGRDDRGHAGKIAASARLVSFSGLSEPVGLMSTKHGGSSS
jgi:hypothetical protein